MGEKFVAIIGGGKFGLQALQWALKNRFKAIVFDSNPQALVRKHVHAILLPNQNWTKSDFIQAPSVLVIGDALEISFPILQEIRPNYIIPTIPVHFFAVVLLYVAQERGLRFIADEEEINRITKEFQKPLNVTTVVPEGILTLSYAQPGEICPSQCIGPKDYCPTFNRKKEKTITQLIIEATKENPSKFLLESRQLTKGLGGIPGDVFFNRIEEFQKNFPGKFVVATTCNCHGVLHALKR